MSIASVGVLIAWPADDRRGGASHPEPLRHHGEHRGATTPCGCSSARTVPSLTAVKIGEEIRALDNITACVFVQKDDALADMMQDVGSTGTLFDAFSGENNPLPNAYDISLGDLALYNQTVEEIQAIEGVSSVSDYSAVADKLSSLDPAGALLQHWHCGGFGHCVPVHHRQHREGDHLLPAHGDQHHESVGATNGFVRVPFIVEGVVIGIIAGLVSATVLYFAYDQAVEVVYSLAPWLTVVSVHRYLWLIYGSYVLAGMFFGLLGGTISISRYLKKQGENAII